MLVINETDDPVDEITTQARALSCYLLLSRRARAVR